MVALFLEADADGSGSVTWEEFHAYLQDEKIKAYFMALELDMSSVVRIFDLLDVDATGELELVEFVEGLIRLRGDAKMVDMWALQKDNAKMSDQLDFMHPMIRNLEESVRRIEKTVEKVGTNNT